CQKYNDSPFIF
nr:immunoglobulin light chain junction region [Macaca mulatta]